MEVRFNQPQFVELIFEVFVHETIFRQINWNPEQRSRQIRKFILFYVVLGYKSHFKFFLLDFFLGILICLILGLLLFLFQLCSLLMFLFFYKLFCFETSWLDSHDIANNKGFSVLSEPSTNNFVPNITL